MPVSASQRRTEGTAAAPRGPMRSGSPSARRPGIRRCPSTPSQRRSSLPRFHIPDAHRLVVAAGDGQAAVGAERAVAQTPAVWPTNVRISLPVLHVAEADHGVGLVAGQELASVLGETQAATGELQFHYAAINRLARFQIVQEDAAAGDDGLLAVRREGDAVPPVAGRAAEILRSSGQRPLPMAAAILSARDRTSGSACLIRRPLGCAAATLRRRLPIFATPLLACRSRRRRAARSIGRSSRRPVSDRGSRRMRRREGPGRRSSSTGREP